jgi:Ca2+-binding EF-hand superfamily protein
MAKLSADEIDDCKEVFDLFDFWDGRDGLVDAAKLGDFLRSLGLNPTEEQVMKSGGCKKMGEKQYKLDELMPIYQDILTAKDSGTFADFMEAFKTFDREGQGYVSSAEVRHVLSAMGDRLTDEEVEEIIRCTDTQEDLDGNIKYEDFIKKVMDGPKK